MEYVMLQPGHLSPWVKIANGESTDGKSLFRGFQSGVDWLVSAYYKDLLAANPDAKVILTERDPERRYENFYSTRYQVDKKFSKYIRLIPLWALYLSQ